MAEMQPSRVQITHSTLSGRTPALRASKFSCFRTQELKHTKILGNGKHTWRQDPSSAVAHVILTQICARSGPRTQ